MKLLMFVCKEFKYEPKIKTIETAPDDWSPRAFQNTIACFIHVEKEDEEKLNNKITKLIKNIKWLARKHNYNHIILHSFSHLSESTLEHDKAVVVFDQAKNRLENVGFEVEITPFGYILELTMVAEGKRYARVFKNL